MKRIILIVVLFTGLTQFIKAQNIPLSSQYLVNKFYLSPSFAGTEDAIPLFLGYRNQWRDFPGAPITKFANANVPLFKNVGVGANLISDKTDIFSHTFFSLTYAYHLRLGDYQFIDFGLTGSGIENNIDFSKITIEDPNDPLLLEKEKYTDIAFNAGASIVFRFNNLHFGVNAPYLLRNKTQYSNENNLDQYMIHRLFVFHGSWNIKFGDDWAFEPFFVGRKTEYTPFCFDAAGLLRYKDMIWLGGFYRNSKEIGINAGFKLNERVLLNYTYEFGNSKIADNSNGTHDITLGFYINKDMKKKQEEQLKKELIFSKATKDFQDELNNQKKQNEVLNEKVDSLYKRLYNAEKQIKDLKRAPYQEQPQVPEKPGTKKTEKPTPQKKIEGVENAETGKYYVVLGSFSIVENAKKDVTNWEEKGFKVNITYSPVTEKYLITAGKFKTKADANKMREKVKAKGIECWIYHFLKK